MTESPLYWIGVIVFAIVGLYMLRPKRNGGSPAPSKSGNFGGYVTDVTALARAKKLEPFEGREAEVERAIHIVMRRSKNNPLLLGHPGVGKTAIVHGLAQRIVDGDVPKALLEKEVLALDLGSLLAGAEMRGELEKRLKRMLQDLERNPRKYILFIDEIHMLKQANGAEGALDITDMLKPALSRGELQIIGATTWDEYERYIHPDPALDRRFQPVLVDEPSPEQAIAMLKVVRHVYEDYHKVDITDEALKAAVQLSDEKIRGRYLPDKAIDLIDEAAAKVAIEASHQRHGVHFGVVHAASASKKRSKRVTKKDIADVVDQWVVHSSEESRRDARAK